MKTKTKAKKPTAKKPYRFPVIIEKDEDGYFASCPSLQGCYTQGDSYEEAVLHIKDAIRLHIEDRKACGEPIPQNEGISFTTLEVEM
jgi:predicted RNase H-like HicB family nuclease